MPDSLDLRVGIPKMVIPTFGFMFCPKYCVHTKTSPGSVPNSEANLDRGLLPIGWLRCSVCPIAQHALSPPSLTAQPRVAVVSVQYLEQLRTPRT